MNRMKTQTGENMRYIRDASMMSRGLSVHRGIVRNKIGKINWDKRILKFKKMYKCGKNEEILCTLKYVPMLQLLN